MCKSRMPLDRDAFLRGFFDGLSGKPIWLAIRWVLRERKPPKYRAFQYPEAIDAANKKLRETIQKRER